VLHKVALQASTVKDLFTNVVHLTILALQETKPRPVGQEWQIRSNKTTSKSKLSLNQRHLLEIATSNYTELLSKLK